MQPRSAGFRTDIPGRSARWVGPERAGDRALAPPGRACPSSALMLSTSASTVSPAAIFRAGVAPSPARPRRREVRSREPIIGTRSGGRRRAGVPVRSRRALPPRGKGTPAGTERCATDPDLAGVPGRAPYQRTVIRRLTPCSGRPSSVAASRRVAALRRQTPPEAVVATALRQREAKLRRPRETTPEGGETIADPGLQAMTRERIVRSRAVADAGPRHGGATVERVPADSFTRASATDTPAPAAPSWSSPASVRVRRSSTSSPTDHEAPSTSAPGSRSALVDTCILREGGLHHAEIKTVMGAAVPAPDGRAGPNRTYAVDLAREFEPTDRVRGPRGAALSDTYGQGRNGRCGRR